MSPAEVTWRARTALRRNRAVPDETTLDWRTGTWHPFLEQLIATNADGLAADARRIAAGELELWGRGVAVDPTAMPWHVHPLLGVPLPTRPTRWTGFDLKPAWELHRHQHLVPLAAGAASTAGGAWGRLCLDQIEDWIRRNPAFGFPGWTSGFETAHRLVAWAWSLPLVAVHGDERLAQVSRAYVRQARFVERSPSRYTSANNHRLGELVGLLAAAVAGVQPDAWNALWAELEWQAERQTFADGGSREQAAGYFLYTLEALWVAGLFAHALERRLGRLGDVLGRRLDWLHAVAGTDGEPPPVGDDSEDRIIRCDYFAPRSAAVLAHRVEMLRAGNPTLGVGRTGPAAGASCLLRDSGLAVFRGEVADDAIRIVTDVGNLGFGSLAAHGHADALAVLVDVGGTPVLRDGGTGSYASTEGRDEFRVTAAHNTVVVDGESQAQPLGPHLWGRRFTCTVDEVRLSPELDFVRASHDGYERRPASARHTRSVLYLKEDLIVVLDRVVSRRPCAATLCWNLGPGSAPERLPAGARMAVAALPTATPELGSGRYSLRYTSQQRAPRATWSARGREILFATVVVLGRSGGTAPALRLASDAGTLVVELLSPRRLRIVEGWSGLPSVSAGA